jgi:hypothetical protein
MATEGYLLAGLREGSPMDPRRIKDAQARYLAKAPNAACPMCGGTAWTGLSDVVSVMAATLDDPVGPVAAKQAEKSSASDLSNVNMVRMDVIAFTCDACSYLRLHA